MFYAYNEKNKTQVFWVIGVMNAGSAQAEVKVNLDKP